MRRAVVPLAWAFASACGGLLAPVDGGSSDGSGLDAGGDVGDETSSVDANDADASLACSYDAASDGPRCAPPPDDLLYASPATVSVAAGSYGTATFVASGPWSTDPGMFMWFVGSTPTLDNDPEIQTYGSPQSLVFLVPSTAAGQELTITVAGYAGNIERTAQVSVNVTSCAPWPASTVCGSYECGFEPDDCGGLVSCGTCPPSAPYCFLRQCVTTMPTYCPYGQGYGENGSCVPCGTTRTCKQCSAVCVGIQDVCICEYAGGG
jgi:hypothetical protein